MALRVLADEHIDHRVVTRLDNYGHDVVHVDFVDDLGKGSTDAAIAAHSLATDRFVLTSDDDFLTAVSSDAYHGLLFVPDEQLAPATVADIVHAIDAAVDADGLSGPLFVTPAWR
jgi:hypothetical protein